MSNEVLVQIEKIRKVKGASLNLSYSNITDLRPLQDLTHLTSLHLRNNKIKDLTPLKEMVNLRQLDLSNNQVSDLTPLSDLKDLEILDVSGNQISDIASVSDLSRLTTLDISSNEIVIIKPLEGLLKLVNLDASNNQIAEIKSLSKLKNLTELYLSHNRISSISPLENLTGLVSLGLNDNLISDLSPILFMLRNGVPFKWEGHVFEGVALANNRISPPPLEIQQQGEEAIIRYFEELERQGSEYLFEAKLLIIGDGGAGKTTLARRMKNPDSLMPREDESTKGIDIDQFRFFTEDGVEFTINIWDFGGQEIYHATHQFFLTKRSLYILVDDTRKNDKSLGDNSLNFWLQTVELLGGGSPILIVQNEKSDRSKDINLLAMKGTYDFLKERYKTNLRTNRGLSDVNRAIQHYIQELPHVGEALPRQWIKIRRKLEELAKQRPYISIEKYFQICAEFNIGDPDRALGLSQYLHDLGVFLHFQDDPVLYKTLILKNEWATDAVYTVLDDEIVKAQKGRFGKKDVDRIWAVSAYRHMHHDLLALMQKFELCYELQDTHPPQFLIPQLLPASQPDDYHWDSHNNLQLRYHYGFMPKGLLSRFIVRMHQYAKDIEKAWQSGVILERENTLAEVKEIYGKNEIHIRISGSSPKDLMTLIMDTFDNMHSGFSRLKVDKRIPCNCDHCRQLDDPHFYVYNDLKRRKEKGKQTIECNVSFEDVDVQHLIGEFFGDVREVDEFETLSPARVFLSYSKDDRKHLEGLIRQLKPLEGRGMLKLWENGKLVPGEDRDDRIKRELASADVILLLVSANWMANDYVMKNELAVAMDRHRKEGTVVVPIILGSCLWKQESFANLTVIPDQGIPINQWDNEDQAWAEVAKKIVTLLEG